MLHRKKTASEGLHIPLLSTPEITSENNYNRKVKFKVHERERTLNVQSYMEWFRTTLFYKFATGKASNE